MARSIRSLLLLVACCAAVLPTACAAAPAKQGPPVRAFLRDGMHDARGPLGKGDVLTIIAKGTPGYAAVFEIPHVFDMGYMREVTPGLYVGTHHVTESDVVSNERVIVHLKGAGQSGGRVLEPPITINGQHGPTMGGEPIVSFAKWPGKRANELVAGDELFVLVHTPDDDPSHYSFTTMQDDNAPKFHRGPDGTLVSWRAVMPTDPPGHFDMGVWAKVPDGRPSLVVGLVPWERQTTGLAAETPSLALAPAPASTKRVRADVGDIGGTPSGLADLTPGNGSLRGSKRQPAMRGESGTTAGAGATAGAPGAAGSDAATSPGGRPGQTSAGGTAVGGPPSEIPGERSAPGPMPGSAGPSPPPPASRPTATASPEPAAATPARPVPPRNGKAQGGHVGSPTRTRVPLEPTIHAVEPAPAPPKSPQAAPSRTSQVTPRASSLALKPAVKEPTDAQRIVPAATPQAAPAERPAERTAGPVPPPPAPSPSAPPSSTPSSAPESPPVPPSPEPARTEPDLAIRSIIRSTHLVWPHYHYRLRISVRNEGGAPADACKLQYELKPVDNPKGSSYAGSIAVPALKPGESQTLTTDAIPYKFRGKYQVRVWLVLPSGTANRPQNNTRTERYTF